MSERKRQKLTGMIDAIEKDIRELEGRLKLTRKRCDLGEISKADFTKARIQLSERIRGKRTRMVQLAKARLNIERAMKEKKEDADKERKHLQELRTERRHEKEKDKRRRADGKEPEEPKKQAKKGFFSFFSK